MEPIKGSIQWMIDRKAIQIRTIRYIAAKLTTFFREALEKENLELQELEKDRAKKL